MATKTDRLSEDRQRATLAVSNAQPLRAQRLHVDHCADADRQIAVLSVDGELTRATHRELLEAVSDAVESRCLRVIVDLHETRFIDSMGMGAILSAYRRVTQVEGGELMVAALSQPVRTVLENACLDRILPIYEDVPAARASLS